MTFLGVGEREQAKARTNSRSPSGMTTRNASATAKANAGVLRFAQNDKGNDRGKVGAMTRVRLVR